MVQWSSGRVGRGPETRNQEPGTRNQKLGTRDQPPAVGRKPSAGSGTANCKLAPGNSRPAVALPQPQPRGAAALCLSLFLYLYLNLNLNLDLNLAAQPRHSAIVNLESSMGKASRNRVPDPNLLLIEPRGTEFTKRPGLRQ